MGRSRESTRRTDKGGWAGRAGVLTLLAAWALLLAACGGESAADGTVTVRVFAAASLTDAFTTIEADFEADNPDIDIELNLAGSTALRTQILNGAPADVFASANQATMDQLVTGGAVTGEPQVFATNRLTIAVPPGNPGQVIGLEDFANRDLFVGLCQPEVPCGLLATEVLDDRGITPEVDSFEPDVRALLTKIETGELDAGLVYVTDLAGSTTASGLTGAGVELEAPGTDPSNLVAIGSDEAVTRYPIATVKPADNGTAVHQAAVRFVDHVLGSGGQAALASFGFGQP